MRRARGERGQILPIVVLALLALLGVSAFAIDVGFAYYAKRQMQAATDAAALAGAQDLPNVDNAKKMAKEYAEANKPQGLSSYDFTYEAKCTNTSVIAGGCDASKNPNDLVVSGTANTTAWFAKLFGIDHFTVSAHASACSPCSSTPVDIVIAIDRTLSMCRMADRSPFPNGECDDLDNAKDGVRTMLGILQAPNAQVGMVAFPPVESTASDPCSAPANSLGNGYDGYDSPDRGYVTDTINSDYQLPDGQPNETSGLYLHTADGTQTSCIQSGGNTSYSEALRQARAELAAHGRPDAPDYIVFLTDGEANIGSVYGADDPVYPPGNADDQQPCQSAVNVAKNFKQEGVTIYSIGYALGDNVPCTHGAFHDASGNPCTPPAADCHHYADMNSPESPEISSYTTLHDIASPGDFFNKPDPGQLDTIFATIATRIGAGSSRLIDDDF
jgi:hypothetical protein